MRRLSWRSLLTVMVGGAVGVALRAAIAVPLSALGHPLLVPVATIAVNIVGAFLLGVLVARLDGRRPGLRLLVGTGVLGGFTTYSGFAVDAATLFRDAPVLGLLLIGVTTLVGLAAAVAGGDHDAD